MFPRGPQGHNGRTERAASIRCVQAEVTIARIIRNTVGRTGTTNGRIIRNQRVRYGTTNGLNKRVTNTGAAITHCKLAEGVVVSVGVGGCHGALVFLGR